MLGRRSRIASCLTKLAKFSPGALALAGGGALAAGGLIAAQDIKSGLNQLSAQNMARRRAMGFRGSTPTPRWGYGAMMESAKKVGS
jgi:hypothetical protein